METNASLPSIYPNIKSGKDGSIETPLKVNDTVDTVTAIAWNTSKTERSVCFFNYHNIVLSINPDGRINYSTEVDKNNDNEGQTIGLVKDGFIKHLIGELKDKS